MIAHRPAAGSHMPNVVIDTALVRHPDGFGIAWRDAKGLHVRKYGPKASVAFRKELKRVDRSRSEYVAHFRFATHGQPCEDLAHPFMYEDPKEGPVLVFHNGIIDITTAKAESDTQVFVRDVLPQLPSAWWTNTGLVTLVDMSIGWSKLVLMTATETINLHEIEGTRDGGLWYSSNHRPNPPLQPILTSGKGSPAAAQREVTSWAADADTAAYWASRSAIAPFTRPAVGAPGVLTHAGHRMTRLRDWDMTVDGDYPTSITCDVCYTTGDTYVIDGSAYFDIAHRIGSLSDDAEGAA